MTNAVKWRHQLWKIIAAQPGTGISKFQNFYKFQAFLQIKKTKNWPAGPFPNDHRSVNLATFFTQLTLSSTTTVAPGGSPKRGVRSKNSRESPLWLRRGPKKFFKGGALPFLRGPNLEGGQGPLVPMVQAPLYNNQPKHWKNLNLIPDQIKTWNKLLKNIFAKGLVIFNRPRDTKPVT